MNLLICCKLKNLKIKKSENRYANSPIFYKLVPEPVEGRLNGLCRPSTGSGTNAVAFSNLSKKSLITKILDKI